MARHGSREYRRVAGTGRRQQSYHACTLSRCDDLIADKSLDHPRTYGANAVSMELRPLRRIAYDISLILNNVFSQLRIRSGNPAPVRAAES